MVKTLSAVRPGSRPNTVRGVDDAAPAGVVVALRPDHRPSDHRHSDHRQRAAVLAATTGGRGPRMDMLTITHSRGAAEDRGSELIHIDGPYADVLAYIADSPECVVCFDTLHGGMARAQLSVP
ncbi:hypothetical protein GBZ26_10580 [Azospirillum formosense]|uniref:Uncharacterized protein n=1 Tax=Azospirillum formosense TaxID=861533 RepID=A0ABX2KWD3_9PROT|nr:hypothetical protein [Azospirillum formosense]MBY3756105.1 hypothetical protein [Azospirillum formosense]NUB19657.1 hypothetical protein [Azospirillum formosense]